MHSFHLFPNLPTELRLKIWNLHSGRIIPIYPLLNQGFATLPSTAPALLQVNRETRELVLETYEYADLAPLCPRGADQDAIRQWNDPSAIAKRSIWIHWEKDTLYLVEKGYEVHGSQSIGPSDTAVQHLKDKVPALKNTRHLALPYIYLGVAQDLCKAWPLLQTITLVRRDEIGFVGRRMEGYKTDAFFFLEAPEEQDLSLPRECLLRHHYFVPIREHHRNGRIRTSIVFCDIVRRN